MLMMMHTIESGIQPSRSELDRCLAAVAAGEQAALAVLYQNTRAAVYALALSILKSAHDAQDVTQDTFVRVWESAPSYRSQGSPMAWILTITRNLAYSKLRQAAKNVDLCEEQWDAVPAEAPGVSPEDRYLLQTALAVLTDEERRIVLLHAVSGLKHREIAALLEIPLATTLSKYHRALKKMREFMKGDDTL